MKTITKKMLSVLMAVLVLLGGIGISLAIEPLADTIEYDTVYDYTTLADHSGWGGWNLAEFGAAAVNNDLHFAKEPGRAGINPNYGLLQIEWGTKGDAYIIYQVAGDTKFEATFAMAQSSDRERWAGITGEPFEFIIEASSSMTEGWKNAVTTAGYNTEAVITYDVPADCRYVKITFPQKGILPGTADVRLNDKAQLSKVKFFKVKPIKYDTVYDYSTLPENNRFDANTNLAATGAYTIGGTPLYREGTAPGINPGYGDLNGKEWGTVDKAYVIYNVIAGSNFEATLKIAANTDGLRKKFTQVTGEPFEFVIEASSNGVDGWKSVGTTEGIDGTLDPSNGAYTDIVLTCDVPEDCTFIKITFPQQGVIPCSDTWKPVGNDMARLCKVRFFKYVDPAFAYDTEYDYSDKDAANVEITNTNKGTYGIYGINTDNAHKLYLPAGGGNDYDGGIGGGYGDLGTEWGTKNAPYVIYKVKEGTKFEFTVRTFSDSSLANHESKVNESLATAIEASANGTDGWKNKVDTKDSSRALSTAGPYVDITITYDVPADCNYVKITLPLKGIITGTSYRGNDLARIMGVKYFKYVAPTIPYDTVRDYSNVTRKEITDANKGEYGFHAINTDNAHKLYANVEVGGDAKDYSGGIGGGYGDLYQSPWGTKNAPYVIYKVKEGSKFEATFRMIPRTRLNNFATAAGEPLEAVIEASANGVDGWNNAVDTAGKEVTPVATYYEDITITYDVPEDCNYVKITLPLKGVIPGSTYCGNDMARIMGVKYFKYVAPAVEYEVNHDYSDINATREEITNSNKSSYGIYAINTDNAHKLYANVEVGGASEDYSGGIGGGWSDLGTEWGTKNKPYVIYKVKEGTSFEATLRMLKGRANTASNAGLTSLEATIEASANGIDGWKNLVDTAGKEGTVVGGYEDIVITYDVPEDCNYVKITLPMQGIVPNSTYRGNDLARIMVVRHFKYSEVGPAYTFVYDYTDSTAELETIGNSNKGKFGIYAVNTDNAHKLIVPTEIGGPGSIYGGGIGGDYGDLGVAWGTKNKPYVIYKVEAGKPFEATFRMIKSRATLAANAGLDSLEATIEASFNGVDGWKNLVDTAGKESTAVGGYEDIVITYNVPSDCQYVKITLPMQGIVPNSANNYRGNDMARIMSVRCFGILPPVPSYDTTYDYSDNTVEQVQVNGGNISNYGIYSYNNSTKAPALWLNETIGNDWRGGISPGYGSLGMPWGELENAFVVYEVKPGTFFEATIRMIGDGSKNNFTNATGEPFEVSVEASTNDMNGWRNKVDTSTASKVAAGPYVDYTITYEVPADCTFVKVTFPQKGIIPGTSARANDAARLMKVRLNAAKNFYEGTDTVMNYKANGAVDFFYDNDAALIYLYKQNGIVIENFSNGAAYVAPSMAYLNSGANIAKPYVVYAVESGTKFVAAINVNRVAAAAMDAGFVVKLYESANGTSWTEAATQVESVGDIDYFTFTTATTAKYVKVEFPHTDAVKNIDKVNEIFGLMAIGFNPNEKDYEIENPYGDYTFTHVDKFHGEEFSVQYDVQNYGIYEDIGGVFAFEAKQGDPYYYLAYGYGNLVNNDGSDYCGFVYSVKPGTAFQAVALLSRNNGDVQLVEKVTGERFDIIVQVSSDGKTWTDYSPSRILTEKSLMELTGVFSRFVTEVITIPVLPSDAKFVKLLYPQTASIKVMTGGVDGRAGNDFIGLSQVSFTKGDAVPPYLYDPDHSKYEEIYDFTSDTYDITALNATGVAYDVGLGALSPAWGYFYQTGKAIREKCAVTVSVKEGTAFYLDFCYRPDRIKLMEGENYSVKLLFSSDCNNWTDVTEKYMEVTVSSGALNYAHRFEIDELPAGVKYVKVEYPHDHDMRGDVTASGKVIGVLGNDNCGIKRIYFTGDDHHNYKHEIHYGYYFEEYDDFPEDIDDTTAKVLGLYDYTKKAFGLGDYTNSEANDGRIFIKETFLFGKKEVDPIYITYNVVPGTEFFMRVPTSASASRLTIMPTAKMKIYASETGKDGSWKEITNYFHVDNANNATTTYYVNNVGAKTNFIKVVFPNTGDLVEQGLAEGASGANFFMIKEVFATLVDYDPTWDGEKKEHNFKKPTLNNKVESGPVVVVNTFNWLFVIIPAAAVLVLAAAAVVIILIVKKKKKAAK